jgi:glycosyltransferase involved in cell wall biosynthesis
MKLIAFTQLRNELSRGNLENWFKSTEICDKRYIIDNNSTDGSLEYYKQFPNTVVIENKENLFFEELIQKQRLLDLVKANEGYDEKTFIYFCDGDIVSSRPMLEQNGFYLKRWLMEASEAGFDFFATGHYNVHRSKSWYRKDLEFHGLHQKWIAFWELKPNLFYPIEEGLHKPQYPIGLTKGALAPFTLLHYGFKSADACIEKYYNYKSLGQDGWNLERLIDEKTLDVEKVSDMLIPDFIDTVNDIDPRQKKKIVEIMKERGLEP